MTDWAGLVRQGLAPALEADARRGTMGSPGPARWVVAVSGGMDSVALLHLLRFVKPVADVELVVAHLDHGMRAGSARDAQFVRGLCRAWRVPCFETRALHVPATEAAARTARYSFLEQVRRRANASLILTAHTQDDQAETLVLRARRGAGAWGLGGIQPFRADGVGRPLLRVARDQLREYAAQVGLVWREDPSNRELRFARNRIRHELIPQWERAYGPTLTSDLAALAVAAREAAMRARARARDVLRAVGRPVDYGGSASLELDQARLQAFTDRALAWVLREAADLLGGALTRAGTRRAVEFSRPGWSGRSVELGNGLRLLRSYDRLLLTGGTAPLPPPLSEIPSLDAWDRSRAEFLGQWGSRAFRVHAGRSSHGARGDWACFATRDVAFPLTVRSWNPGDRVRFSYGRKKVKKLFAETRTPTWRRAAHPVVADGRGRVLWLPGVARANWARATAGEPAFTIGFESP